MRPFGSRPLYLFVAMSLAAHGAAFIGTFHVGRGKAVSRPLPVASSLKSDTETELPLSEASGDTEPAPDAIPAAPVAEQSPAAPTDAPGSPTPAATTKSRPSKPPAAGSAGGPGAQPGLIGAVGEPGAVELETAFLRALPQVASFDKDWHREPIGATATITVTAEVDASGHLQQVTDASTSTPLNRAVTRALAQLKPRLLTAHAARTRITVTCTVHTDEVHDGWHGDVFALGATAQGRGGTGFVSLATGRRVDFVVVAR